MLRILAVAAGAVIVWETVGAAVRTVILPRAVPSRLTRVVFLSLRFFFQLWIGKRADYARRDRVMAMYAPVGLLALLVAWVTLTLAAYLLIFWGLSAGSPFDAFVFSGSSLLTLGLAHPEGVAGTALAFTEAGIGLFLLALLITYLPTIYSQFSARESAVTALEIRAGSPPSGVEMIERYWVLERIDRMAEVWTRWEDWFVQLEESHTSLPVLTFFRSPQPDHSWITAAGAVLDGASLMASTVDVPRDVQAEFCIRAGYLALRRIADFFRIPYDAEPKQGDPISIAREEYEEAVHQLAEAGVPLKPDRDQTWLDFAGWRVNYDTVLIALAGLTAAPYAPWSSDRSLRQWHPSLRLRRLPSPR
jgi:hypothetical protein